MNVCRIHSGFPFWILNFDESGALRDGSSETNLLPTSTGEPDGPVHLLARVEQRAQSGKSAVPRLLRRSPARVGRQDLPAKREGRIGVCGVVWPSVAWPDESPASVTGATRRSAGSASDPFTGLRRTFSGEIQKPPWTTWSECSAKRSGTKPRSRRSSTN